MLVILSATAVCGLYFVIDYSGIVTGYFGHPAFTRAVHCANILNFELNRTVSYYSIWSKTNPTIRNFSILIYK